MSTRNRFGLPTRRAARDGPRRRLFIKYLIVLVGLVGAAVLVTSLVALFFTHQDTVNAASDRLEKEASQAARSLHATVLLASLEVSEAIPPTPPGGPPPTLAARRASYQRHLGRFTGYVYVDHTGRQRLRVGDLGPTGAGDGRDLSRDPTVRLALASLRRGNVVVFGPVSGPTPVRRTGRTANFPRLLPIAIREGRDPRGVTFTRLNASLLVAQELVSQADPSAPSASDDVLVYLVDSSGLLLGQFDGPAVGGFGDLTDRSHVVDAVASAVPGLADPVGSLPVVYPVREASWEHDANGRSVLSASALVPGVGWQVFAEESRGDVLAPVYDAALRTGVFLVIFLALAVLASALLARRMVRPIARIESGARRIGEGALDERIELNTGDELQSLAEEFNRMAGQLEDLYADLERRVEDRTRDLSGALKQNATLLRELEHKSRDLEAASRHKSEFLATMSHELRTPLNAIIGFSEVLRERMFGELNERQAEYLDDIHVSGRHLLTLIDDILDLAKVESGQMELDLGDVDVGECLETGFMMVRERAKLRGVRLEMDVEPGLDQVTADGRKLKQIVFNLLSNAVRFTPEGGLVEASARRADGEVRIAVRDSGPGIAPEDQERIFETFQQAGNGGAREGTGLGLALSRAFAELHGGRLWVESRLGEGSTFVLALPLVPAVAGP